MALRLSGHVVKSVRSGLQGLESCLPAKVRQLVNWRLGDNESANSRRSVGEFSARGEI